MKSVPVCHRQDGTKSLQWGALVGSNSYISGLNDLLRWSASESWVMRTMAVVVLAHIERKGVDHDANR